MPRLFSGEAILAHTLLLTPVTGALLAAINHRRLGNGPAFRNAILAFGVPSAVALLVPEAVSDDRTSAILRLVAFGWTLWLARRLYAEHRDLHAKHLAAGGPTARWYLATLVVVAIVVLGLLALFATELADR